MNYNFLLIPSLLSLCLLAACSETDKPTPAKKESQEVAVQKTEELTPPIKREGENGSAVTPQTTSVQPDPSIDLQSLLRINHGMDLVIGSANASVVVVEYSSPTCPHCSYFHKDVLPKLKEKWVDTGKIAYVIREFIANKQDFDAAMLGRCYKNEEDPLKLLNVIYLQQENWAFNKNYKEILGNIGQLAGISREMYNKCIVDAELTKFLIGNSKSIAAVPGFVGTPAFYVDGAPHKGGYDFEGLSQGIEAAIKKKEGAALNEKQDAKSEVNATTTPTTK